MKDIPHHMSSMKFKLKQWGDTATYLLEWPKYRTLTTPSASENVEQKKNSHLLLIGIQNETATFLTKLNYALTTWSSSNVPYIYPKKLKMYVYTKTYIWMFIAAFIHNGQNLEATKMSSSKWMYKWTVVYPDTGILFSTKKKWVIKPQKDMKKT